MEFLLNLILVIVSIFYRLFVITKAWLYLAVPLGAKPIELEYAFCLTLAGGLFFRSKYVKRSSAELTADMLSQIIVDSIIWALLYWLAA